MRRANTGSYILEFRLSVTKADAVQLEHNFNAARSVYNACLGKAMKCLRALLGDKELRENVKRLNLAPAGPHPAGAGSDPATLGPPQLLPMGQQRGCKGNERHELFRRNKAIEQKYGYSEFQLHDYVNWGRPRHRSWGGPSHCGLR